MAKIHLEDGNSQLCDILSHATPVLFDAIAEALKGTDLPLKMISFSAAISKVGWQWWRAAPLRDEMCAGGSLSSLCSFPFP
eukprot:8330130-Karenia_brevis.AAC.1